MQRSRTMRFKLSQAWDALLPLVVAVVGAFLVGAIILILLDANPLEAYGAMISGAFGNNNGLADVLVKATPLLLVALGIIIACRHH